MKKKISITIDETVIKKIENLSAREDRTLSSQVNKILKDYLSSEERGK